MYPRLWLALATLVVAAPVMAQTSATPQSPDSAQTTAMQAAPSVPVAAVTPTAPDFPRGKISGYVFGDYYYNAVGDPRHAYNAAGSDSGKANIDGTGKPITRDLNGFQIRRVYFQLDNDLSIKYSTRFRLEADSKSLTSDGKIGLAVKALYLQARNVYPRGDLFFGILPTPIYETEEEAWGYRSIEKTLADFRGIGSSTDIGAEVKGFVDTGHRIGYSAMVGNGLGQKPEDNRDKKGYLALPIHVGDLRMEPFVDYENVANHQDRATYKLFADYEFRKLVLGGSALSRVNHRTSAPNQEPRGFSAFGRWTQTPTVAAFARFDLWQPDHRIANRVDTQLWIAGLDWQPFKDVHFMPNVEATQYTAKGTAVAPAFHDLQARLTIYYKFAKPS